MTDVIIPVASPLAPGSRYTRHIGVNQGAPRGGIFTEGQAAQMGRSRQASDLGFAKKATS